MKLRRQRDRWAEAFDRGRQAAARDIREYADRHDMAQWSPERQRVYGGVAQAYEDAAAIAERN